MTASSSVRVDVARFVYRHLPLPESLKRRIRYALKTRFAMLFGRGGAPPYEEWVRRYDVLGVEDVASIRQHIDSLASRPRFACFVDVPRAGLEFLPAFIDGLRDQLYPDWTLHLVARDAQPIERSLGAGGSADPRIDVLVGDSFASTVNTALSTLEAEAVACIDTPGVPARHALYLAAVALAGQPGAHVVYGDEDRLAADGDRKDPWFKPDWDPEYLLSADYLGSWTFFRRDALLGAGGLRAEAGTVQHLDLALRMTGGESANAVVHLPFVTFHRAAAPTGSGTDRVGVVRSYLQRVGEPVESVEAIPSGVHVRYRSLPESLVSVVIPTRDHPALLRRCVEGILHRTSHRQVEIVIVDNRSVQPATLRAFDELTRDPRVRVLRHDAPFNYSALINAGVRESRGDMLALLNDDVEVTTPEWLGEMVGQASRPSVGVVGARLLYPDGGIQHVGIVLGTGFGGGHVYRHRRPTEDVHGELSLTRSRRALTFACVVVRRETFSRAGGLDEQLEIAFNDVDFCLKVERLGLRNLVVPAATLTHFEAASRGFDDDPERRAIHRRELDLMLARWGDSMRSDRYHSPNLAADESGDPAFPPRVAKPWRTARS